MKTSHKNLLQLVGLILFVAGLAIIFNALDFQTEKSKGQISYTSPALEDAKLNRLTIFDKKRAYPGFTVFPLDGSAQVHLLNMSGEIVHVWQIDAVRARLLPNCNLLMVHGTKWGSRLPTWKLEGRKVKEYSWDSQVIWEYSADSVIHHDVRRLENGNTMFLQRTLVPKELKTGITDAFRRRLPLRSDAIVELDENSNIAWQWFFHEAMDINSCGRQGCSENNKSSLPGKERIDWSHINTIAPLPPNKWFEQGHSAFRPGNILIVPRNFWMAFIVDRVSKKIVWEYGGDYKGGIIRGHEAHMIPNGMPGAGNILILDNGQIGLREESYILEINPVSKEIVWVYDVGAKFFTNSAGSVQRLANGNTLISEDVRGRLFEVTPESEIVWEYIWDFRIGRPSRYDYDYCAKFAGLKR